MYGVQTPRDLFLLGVAFWDEGGGGFTAPDPRLPGRKAGTRFLVLNSRYQLAA